MARPKSRQTTVEKQHAKLLKKRGVRIVDWEEETFKKAIGDIASKDEKVFEDVLDIYRKKEVDAEINAFLESKEKDSVVQKKEPTTNNVEGNFHKKHK